MRRNAARLSLLGVGAGAMTALAAAWANAGACAYDPQGTCRGLVRTFSLRVGLVAGLFAVLLALMAAGLARMAAQDERRRDLGPGGSV